MRPFIVLTALAVSCYQPPDTGYEITIVDSGNCKQICEDLTRLECPEGDSSPGGHPCAEFCGLALTVIKIDGNCLHSATTQADVRRCGIRCRN